MGRFAGYVSSVVVPATAKRASRTAPLSLFNLQPEKPRVNIQSPEKTRHRPDGYLDVVSIFRTIQGEGPFAGMPAIFIRLAGCNLQCPGCDTDYTSSRAILSPKQILNAVVDQVSDRSIHLVVITGGEPFRQDIFPLVCKLKQLAFNIQVETNGTLGLGGIPYDRLGMHIVCSPKAAKIHLHIQNLMVTPYCALKYVIKSGDISMDDGLPIHVLDHPVHTRVARPFLNFPPSQIYLQPMDEGDAYDNKLNLNAAINSCIRYGYRLSLQTHKIIGVP